MEKICQLIDNETSYKTLGSCCGHGKYPMTIVVTKGYGNPIEYFSKIEISRSRRFYSKDREGIFYIPELNFGATRNSP